MNYTHPHTQKAHTCDMRLEEGFLKNDLAHTLSPSLGKVAHTSGMPENACMYIVLSKHIQAVMLSKNQ